MEVADTKVAPNRAVPERMTVAEGLELARQWQGSGLSRRAFSRARGIGAYCLWYWKKRAATLAAETEAFVVIEPEEVEEPSRTRPPTKRSRLCSVMGISFASRKGPPHWRRSYRRSGRLSHDSCGHQGVPRQSPCRLSAFLRWLGGYGDVSPGEGPSLIQGAGPAFSSARTNSISPPVRLRRTPSRPRRRAPRRRHRQDPGPPQSSDGPVPPRIQPFLRPRCLKNASVIRAVSRWESDYQSPPAEHGG